MIWVQLAIQKIHVTSQRTIIALNQTLRSNQYDIILLYKILGILNFRNLKNTELIAAPLTQNYINITSKNVFTWAQES